MFARDNQEAADNKLCSKCGSKKLRPDFPPNKQRKDGLSSWCRSCARAAAADWAKRNPDRARARTDAYRKRLGADAWAKRSARWRALNPEKAKITIKSWDQRNPAKRRENGMRRYAAKRGQTLPLTADQRAQIVSIYAQCARLTATTGVEHNVDHVIPLRGKTVCGLHVPWNLEIKTGEQNRRKSNKLLEGF